MTDPPRKKRPKPPTPEEMAIERQQTRRNGFIALGVLSVLMPTLFFINLVRAMSSSNTFAYLEQFEEGFDSSQGKLIKSKAAKYVDQPLKIQTAAVKGLDNTK